MGSSRYKVGIVGVGFGQQVLVPAFRLDPRCEVVAICASNEERARLVAEKEKIPHSFSDWTTLVSSPDLDVIAIALPPSIQPQVAIAGFEMKKAVFCEKPVSVDLGSARTMLAVARERGAVHAVDFELPELTSWKRTKALLEAGDIGNLRHISVQWNIETYANRHLTDSWKTRSAEGGGTLSVFLSHTFHYLEWFGGRIRGLMAKLFQMPRDLRKGESFVVIALELASGVGVSVTASSHAYLGSGHRIEFFGQDGTLILDNPARDYANGFRLLRGTRGSGELEVTADEKDLEGPGHDGRIGAVGRLVHRFIDSLETRNLISPSLEQGVRTQVLIEAAVESHRLGKWVQV